MHPLTVEHTTVYATFSLRVNGWFSVHTHIAFGLPGLSKATTKTYSYTPLKRHCIETGVWGRLGIGCRKSGTKSSVLRGISLMMQDHYMHLSRPAGAMAILIDCVLSSSRLSV